MTYHIKTVNGHIAKTAGGHIALSCGEVEPPEDKHCELCQCSTGLTAVCTYYATFDYGSACSDVSSKPASMALPMVASQPGGCIPTGGCWWQAYVAGDKSVTLKYNYGAAYQYWTSGGYVTVPAHTWLLDIYWYQGTHDCNVHGFISCSDWGCAGPNVFVCSGTGGNSIYVTIRSTP